MRGAGLPSLLATVLLGSCAHYEPEPIDAPAHILEYRARRLDDSALVTWVGRWAGAIAPTGWTDRQLAVAALALRAEVPRARAEWRAVRAGEQTAGGRPQPGASTDVERAVSGGGGQSPWVVSIAALLTLELGGKRSARLRQAQARTAVAEAELAATAWRVARDTRRAALDVTLAEVERDGTARELSAIADVLSLEMQRFAETAVTSSEVARTGSEVAEVRGATARAERERIEARAALAAAIGLPPRVFDSIAVAPVGAPGCDRLDALGADSLQVLALTRRPEMPHVLAEYAGAEATLQLQVARQYPDLDLGPGFTWDQGVHRWTLALAAPGLLAFRNRGPIYEAEAARTAAAARVVETQDSILGDLAVAGERCRGARIERVATDSQTAVAARSVARARGAYGRGETPKLDAALAELALARAERARRDADRRVAAAGFAVEAATGEWLGEDAPRWPDPREESGEEAVPK